MNPRPVKISPYDVEPQRLKHRNNYKLIDPAVMDVKHLTFCMVVVEPGGVCEPGHAHEEQEEIMFGLTGKGAIVVGDDREAIEIAPKDALFIPPTVYHAVTNPSNTPFEMLWILSPPGWVFDDPALAEKAEKGEAL